MTMQRIAEDAGELARDIEHLAEDLAGDTTHLAEDAEHLADDSSHLAEDLVATGAEKAKLSLEDAGLMNFLMVEATLDSVDALLNGARELGTVWMQYASEEMSQQLGTLEEMRKAQDVAELGRIGMRSWQAGVERQLGGWAEAMGVVASTGLEIGSAYAERLRPFGWLAYLDWAK